MCLSWCFEFLQNDLSVTGLLPSLKALAIIPLADGSLTSFAVNPIFDLVPAERQSKLSVAFLSRFRALGEQFHAQVMSHHSSAHILLNRLGLLPSTGHLFFEKCIQPALLDSSESPEQHLNLIMFTKGHVLAEKCPECIKSLSEFCSSHSLQVLVVGKEGEGVGYLCACDACFSQRYLANTSLIIKGDSYATDSSTIISTQYLDADNDATGWYSLFTKFGVKVFDLSSLPSIVPSLTTVSQAQFFLTAVVQNWVSIIQTAFTEKKEVFTLLTENNWSPASDGELHMPSHLLLNESLRLKLGELAPYVNATQLPLPPPSAADADVNAILQQLGVICYPTAMDIITLLHQSAAAAESTSSNKHLPITSLALAYTNLA